MPEALSLREGPLERRYLALTRLGSGLAGCMNWSQLAETVSWSLGAECAPVAVRLWGNTPEGPVELGAFPANGAGGAFEPAGVEDLSDADTRDDPLVTASGSTVIALRPEGLNLGALETGPNFDDLELLAHAAAIVAPRFGLLANRGEGEPAITPRDPGPTEDSISVMTEFASEAKRLLDHDRLSAYLLTPNRHAFERFAVAGSPLLDGEGVLIPYGEVGLRHVIEANEALVSPDLAEDSRIMGREDRVIARAGFHGLVSVPLRHDGRPFGVLNFVSRHPGFYSDNDIPIAEQIASQIGAFIENLRSQRRIRMHVKQRAAEAERARISRDLYQTVAESASTIVTLANELDATAGDRQIRESAGRIADVAKQELIEFRRAVTDLTPRALELHNLTDLIVSSAEKLRKARGIEPVLDIADGVDDLPLQTKRTLYRIVQEALNNVGLHSNAGRVELSLALTRGVELTIRDDGIGFDHDAQHSGLGISHMRDRSEAIGGHLSVDSTAGLGTTVTFVLDSIRSTPHFEGDPIERVEGPVRPSIRVLVAAPGELTRAGIASLLSSEAETRVVGEATGVQAIAGKLRQLQPDVLVAVDEADVATLPTIAADIKRLSANTKLLVIGDFSRQSETELFALGANGVLPRDCGPKDLADAVETIAGGGVLIRAVAEGEDGEEAGSDLSRREREILTLIAAGATNAEIGKNLYLATKTVERQVATITRKLDARNRAHAAAIGVARKVVSLNRPPRP